MPTRTAKLPGLGHRMSTRGVGIVTGGGSGIGRAIAIRLAEDGYAVAVLDLDTSAAELGDGGDHGTGIGGLRLRRCRCL